MNEYVNPPGKSLLATSLSFEILSSTEEEREVRKTSPFGDEIFDEGALEIDERVAQRSVSLIPHLS